MAALALLRVLLSSLFLIGCLAQDVHVSLPQSLSGTELKTTSVFWQCNLATCAQTEPNFCVRTSFSLFLLMCLLLSLYSLDQTNLSKDFF